MPRTALAPRSTPAHSNAALALIRRTVAIGTTDDEFNVFMWTATQLGLDPLRRQIYAFVYDRAKPTKRRMSIVVGIDGFRAIADRTGNYRPDESEPDYEESEDGKSATNPAGLIKATVRVFKRSHGEWHKVTASAYWDEYVPLKDEWQENIESGRSQRTGRQTLDLAGNWGRMPRLMLSKVAEALALRKAWPEDLANVYATEELDRARMTDVLPADAAQIGEAEDRLERLQGKGSVLVIWDETTLILEPTPIGSLADRCLEFIQRNVADHARLRAWQNRNRHAFQEFWARAPSDALAVKKELEGILGVDTLATS